MLRKLALALLGVSVASATMGWDGIQSVSVSGFQCLKSNGFSFYIARVWESTGNYDTAGMQNMKNAKAAGFAHTDGYLFPCHRSGCASPAAQVQATVNKLNADGVPYGQLWLDIEVQDWPADLNANRNFIMAMGNELDAMKVSWGIYTNANNWGQIVGNDWTHYSNKPLWWASWNGAQNFNGFSSFGGWTKPAMRQYLGDKAGPCGVNMLVDKIHYVTLIQGL